LPAPGADEKDAPRPIWASKVEHASTVAPRRCVMSSESWIVRTLGGEEWGFVKRLILDSVTKQISHADVVLSQSGRLMRIPWESFEVQNDGIKLSISERQAYANSARPHDMGMTEAVAMEVWP